MRGTVRHLAASPRIRAIYPHFSVFVHLFYNENESVRQFHIPPTKVGSGWRHWRAPVCFIFFLFLRGRVRGEGMKMVEELAMRMSDSF